MFDCHNFVKENPDVIVVTIAYRLGVFGFLHLSHLSDGKDYPDAQNLEALDQIAALRWINENIETFGGNPDNITTFGESADSISSMLLSVTLAAKGLFNKVIPQSCTSNYYNTRKYSADNHCTMELNSKACVCHKDLNTQNLNSLRYFYEN